MKADEKLLSLYEAMERGFRSNAHGENQRTTRRLHGKDSDISRSSHVDGELARANERLDALQKIRKDTALRKVQEVQAPDE